MAPMKRRSSRVAAGSAIGPRALASCGCDAKESAELSGEATTVDPGAKERNLTRLRRIEGQVRGLQAMIREDRICGDVMMQVSSVYEALRAVGRELLRSHLKYCASPKLNRVAGKVDQMLDEVIVLMHKHGR